MPGKHNILLQKFHQMKSRPQHPSHSFISFAYLVLCLFWVLPATHDSGALLSKQSNKLTKAKLDPTQWKQAIVEKSRKNG